MTVASGSGVTKEAKKLSPYRAVREILDSLNQKGQYDIKEINKVAEEIEQLHQRIEKIHSLSKEFRAITLSPYINTMLKIVGKHRIMEDFNL